MSTHPHVTEPQDVSVSMASRQEISVTEVQTCLLQNSSIDKSATNLWIDFEAAKYFDTEISSTTETQDDHVCRFAVTTPTNTVARVRFVRQNCSRDNYIQVWVHVKRRHLPLKTYLDSRTGCENWTSPLVVDYLSLTNHVTFAFVVRQWTASFFVSLQVTAETPEQPLLQQYQLSPYMGMYLAIRLSLHTWVYTLISVCLSIHGYIP